MFQTCPSFYSSGGDLHVVRENVGPEESEHKEELQQGKENCESGIVTSSLLRVL